MVEVECRVSSLVFSQMTRIQCLHGCLHFNRSPMCPPLASEVSWFEELLSSYSRVRILYERYEYSDFYELEVQRSRFNSSVLSVESTLKKDGHFYALGFISGPCSSCDADSCCLSGCNRPLLGRSPVCSAGIDLKHLAEHILNFPDGMFGNYWKKCFGSERFINDIDEHLCLGLVFY